VGIADYMERAFRDRACGRLDEVGMMMRLQYRHAFDFGALVCQLNPDDASRVGDVLHAKQIAVVPVKAIDPSRHYRVRLR
jgi:hypothetical protein